MNSIRIIFSKLGDLCAIERQFSIKTYQDALAVISILRGTARFTCKGQLWAYIPEGDVWLVQYKINTSNYGLRASFAEVEAHKYRLDRAI